MAVVDPNARFNWLQPSRSLLQGATPENPPYKTTVADTGNALNTLWFSGFVANAVAVTMQAIDRLNSNLALASALVLYPLLFRLITPRNASPSHFVRSREAISATHAVLISLASVLELYRQRDRWIPPALRSETGLKDGPSAGSQHAGQQPDIIHARCPFGNAIVAWECGYLAQDFVVLLLGARSTPAATDGRRSRSVMAKSFNWRVIGGHHLGLVTALSLFHLRALRGEAKGVLVVLMMFLMNLSYVRAPYSFFAPGCRAALPKRRGQMAGHRCYNITARRQLTLSRALRSARCTGIWRSFALGVKRPLP